MRAVANGARLPERDRAGSRHRADWKRRDQAAARRRSGGPRITEPSSPCPREAVTAPYQSLCAVGRHGKPAAPFVAGRMVVPSWLAAGDAAMRAIRRLPNADRMPSIRAGVTTARRDSRIGIPAHDNRKAIIYLAHHVQSVI